MVILSNIYTRTGDAGETSLAAGTRISKAALRVATFGTVDETNACIGMARLHTGAEGPSEIDAMLARIQNDLFDLGADLATAQGRETRKGEAMRVTPAQVARLEAEIDQLNAELEPVQSFILPGGTPAAATLHLARTVARRAERLMVELAGREGEAVGEPALHYINRLSDLLFVAARYVNGKGAHDILWVPGENR